MTFELIYFLPHGAALPAPSVDDQPTIYVVIDALRATSTITTALAHGAEAVRSFATVEKARAYKEAHPDVLLAGERGGHPLPGFDLGNSPREMTSETVKGRSLALTTSNGTPALQAAAHTSSPGDVVLAASLLNTQAIGTFIETLPKAQTCQVRVICAGTGRGFSLEDAITASALATQLPLGEQHPARTLWQAYGKDTATLLATWQASRNGRNLVKIGRGEDIAFCLQTNRYAIVPRLDEDGWLRAVAGSP